MQAPAPAPRPAAPPPPSPHADAAWAPLPPAPAAAVATAAAGWAPPPPRPLPRAGLMTPDQRRTAFAAAAAAAASRDAAALAAGPYSGGEQRTAEWRALRDARLTASAFGNALGFWPRGREELWAEKAGLAAPFAGNAATAYGTRAEPAALAAYAAATGAAVADCRFEVLLDDDAHRWLGASPDGLVTRGGADGVLEIKCPFNRGRPDTVAPWPHPPDYYMPQVQGLLAVLGRPWCDVWCWTPARGAAAWRVDADPGYWAAAYDVLADFWWAHVVPARHALAVAEGEGGVAGRAAAAATLLPPPSSHPLTPALRARSLAMAKAAPMVRFEAHQLPRVDVREILGEG